MDISRLAVFLGKVKTSVFSQVDLDILLDWAIDIVPELSPRNPVRRHLEWKEAGYQDNLPWRFRKVAEQALNNTDTLPERLRPVARCVVFKTVQWAVDCKRHLPTAANFRERMIDHAVSVNGGLQALGGKVASIGKAPSIEVFFGPAETISTLPSKLLRHCPPRLVITSPPYPGIHVLYHRWQVQGRKETPAPFWIADCLDGRGSSFYTFGDRRNQQHRELYFGKLLKAFKEIRKVLREDSVVVQLVGFGNPKGHLQCYLETMREAGFVEHETNGHRANQCWRSVPNRKWYTCLRDEMKQASEVLLVHRLA